MCRDALRQSGLVCSDEFFCAVVLFGEYQHVFIV